MKNQYTHSCDFLKRLCCCDEPRTNSSCCHSTAMNRGRGRDYRGRGRARDGAVNSGQPSAELPLTAISFHQPIASMIAWGLQRIDGRVWSSTFRGPLWIHAASKEPTSEAIKEYESFYRHVHSLDGTGEAKLPPSYPTSCLVGKVEVVDWVTADEYLSWETLPPGVREEAAVHGRDFYFLFHKNERLALPIRMSGQHKLWQLPHSTAKALLDGGLESSEQMPISFAGHRQAKEAVAQGGAYEIAGRAGHVGTNSLPTEPTNSMKRNARRQASKVVLQLPPSDIWEAASGLEQALPSEALDEAPPSNLYPAQQEEIVEYEKRDGTLCTVRIADDLSGHIASASSPAVAEFQARIQAGQLASRGIPLGQVATRLSRSLEWAEHWCYIDIHQIPRPRSLPDWLPIDCFRDVEMARGFLQPDACQTILNQLLTALKWRPANYLKRSEDGALEVATDEAGKPIQANTRLQAPYNGGVHALDEAIAAMMVRWGVVDSQCSLLLNRYDTGGASIATHRHDFWSAILTLGHKRVFLLDDRRAMIACYCCS